ncbi:biopolymer transport protein ExbB [Bradyrhizobium sp. i1.4.4]
MTLDHLTELAAQSDGILYVMAVLLLIALTVIIDRFWFLGRTIRRGKRVTSIVAQLAHLDRKTLADLAEKSPRLPHRALLEVPLQHSELKDAHRMSELLEEAILWQVPKLDSRLWLLDTIVTLAPLLGLLGTIAGMVKAFAVLGDAGNAATQITGGVAARL